MQRFDSSQQCDYFKGTTISCCFAASCGRHLEFGLSAGITNLAASNVVREQLSDLFAHSLTSVEPPGS